MRFACWVTEATDTHSEYTILFFFFRRQQWSCEGDSMFTLHVHCVPWSGQFQTHVSQRHQLYHNQVLSRTCCSLLIWPVSLKFSCAILSLGAPCIWLRTAVGGTANSLGIQPKTLKIRREMLANSVTYAHTPKRHLHGGRFPEIITPILTLTQKTTDLSVCLFHLCFSL